MEPQDNNQNPQRTPTKKLFSEALIVAFLPGVGYLAAFAYQYSYLRYFNVPTFFIDINLGLILLTTSVGLIWIAGIGMVLNFLENYKPNRIFVRIIKDISLYLALVILILFPMIASIYNPENIWLFLIFFFVVFIIFAITFIRLYRNPELLDKKIENKRNKNDFLFKAEQTYGFFSILFVAILFFFVVYSASMGTIVAQNKTEWLVSNTNPRLIIISTYADNLVGLTFNTSTLKFNKEILLLSKDRVYGNNIIFSFEKIGRLTSN